MMRSSPSLLQPEAVKVEVADASVVMLGAGHRVARYRDRLSSVGLICFLLVLVVLSIVALGYSRAALTRSESDHREMRAQVMEGVGVQRRVEAARIQEERIAKLLKQAGQMNLQREGWTERKINIQGVDMQRVQVNDLMRDIVSNSRQVFGAEIFEVSVKDLHSGLFDVPRNADDLLVVTLKGASMYRASPVKP